MAALAICLLFAAAMAGFSAPAVDSIGETQRMAGTASESSTPTQSVRSVKARKGLKFNFYLFRHK